MALMGTKELPINSAARNAVWTYPGAVTPRFAGAPAIFEMTRSHERPDVFSLPEGADVTVEIYGGACSLWLDGDRCSPEGYFYDSFNYSALIESLLVPLGPGGSRQYRSAVFDYRNESEMQTAMEVAEENDVLLFDGVFLLREELVAYWDFTVFVEAAFQTTLRRAEQRDTNLFGSVEEVRDRYEQRYIPGQRLYFDSCRPRERANVAIDNNDLRNPKVV